MLCSAQYDLHYYKLTRDEKDKTSGRKFGSGLLRGAWTIKLMH